MDKIGIQKPSMAPVGKKPPVKIPFLSINQRLQPFWRILLITIAFLAFFMSGYRLTQTIYFRYFSPDVPGYLPDEELQPKILVIPREETANWKTYYHQGVAGEEGEFKGFRLYYPPEWSLKADRTPKDGHEALDLLLKREGFEVSLAQLPTTGSACVYSEEAGSEDTAAVLFGEHQEISKDQELLWRVAPHEAEDSEFLKYQVCEKLSEEEGFSSLTSVGVISFKASGEDHPYKQEIFKMLKYLKILD
jgi:hypothetical protein